MKTTTCIAVSSTSENPSSESEALPQESLAERIENHISKQENLIIIIIIRSSLAVTRSYPDSRNCAVDDCRESNQ